MRDINSVKDLLEAGKQISKLIFGEKFESLRIVCKEDENIGVYTATVHAGNIVAKQMKKRYGLTKKFDRQEVSFVKMYGLKPISKRIYDAVEITPTEYILNLNKIIELNLDSFRIEIGYRMNHSSLEGIVRSRSSPEPLEDRRLYHISAQLTDPDSLIEGFSECEIEEFPITLSIQIQEDITTNIPFYVKKMSEIEEEILRDYNPHSAIKILGLQKQKARLKKRFGKEDLRSKFTEISLFLRPSKFRSNYIDISGKKEFILGDCKWGGDIFRVLGLTMLPKTMEVIMRTNLNLDKPAASGIMIYKSRKFSEDIHKLFLKKK